MNGSAQEGKCTSLLWTALGLSTLCLLGLFLSVATYAKRGDVLLRRMDVSVGEVLMKKGIRLEEAGFPGEAAVQYRVALRARYQGEQNRIQTLERLGRLSVEGGAHEMALPYLRKAAASAHARLTVYAPFVEALLEVGANEEARDVAGRWREKAIEKEDIVEEALASYQLGFATQAIGADAEESLGHHGDSVRAVAGGEAAWALAQYFAAEGQTLEALEQVEMFLLYSATGEGRDAAVALRETLKDR
jgi:tetratricopeptide (TPR) repeat protein